jgi:hypothetical protein
MHSPAGGRSVSRDKGVETRQTVAQ